LPVFRVRGGVEDDATFAERPVCLNLECPPGGVIAVGVGNVERLLVRRKSDAVRRFQVFGKKLELTVF
jgi:hypothetical protein